MFPSTPSPYSTPCARCSQPYVRNSQVGHLVLNTCQHVFCLPCTYDVVSKKLPVEQVICRTCLNTPSRQVERTYTPIAAAAAAPGAESIPFAALNIASSAYPTTFTPTAAAASAPLNPFADCAAAQNASLMKSAETARKHDELVNTILETPQLFDLYAKTGKLAIDIIFEGQSHNRAHAIKIQCPKVENSQRLPLAQLLRNDIAPVSFKNHQFSGNHPSHWIEIDTTCLFPTTFSLTDASAQGMTFTDNRHLALHGSNPTEIDRQLTDAKMTFLQKLADPQRITEAFARIFKKTDFRLTTWDFVLDAVARGQNVEYRLLFNKPDAPKVAIKEINTVVFHQVQTMNFENYTVGEIAGIVNSIATAVNGGNYICRGEFRPISQYDEEAYEAKKDAVHTPDKCPGFVYSILVTQPGTQSLKAVVESAPPAKPKITIQFPKSY
jgi:hypothetical protein